LRRKLGLSIDRKAASTEKSLLDTRPVQKAARLRAANRAFQHSHTPLSGVSRWEVHLNKIVNIETQLGQRKKRLALEERRLATTRCRRISLMIELKSLLKTRAGGNYHLPQRRFRSSSEVHRIKQYEVDTRNSNVNHALLEQDMPPPVLRVNDQSQIKVYISLSW